MPTLSFHRFGRIYLGRRNISSLLKTLRIKERGRMNSVEFARAVGFTINGLSAAESRSPSSLRLAYRIADAYNASVMLRLLNRATGVVVEMTPDDADAGRWFAAQISALVGPSRLASLSFEAGFGHGTLRNYTREDKAGTMPTEALLAGVANYLGLTVSLILQSKDNADDAVVIDLN